MSLGFSRLSSLRLNSLEWSSQTFRSSSFSHSFCWLSQSGLYVPVSETRSTSKPDSLKTLNGCKASVTKSPVSLPSGYRGACADVTAIRALRGGAILDVLYSIYCYWTWE